MAQCVKCKNLIKPVSLAVMVAGEPQHPQCLSCLVCDRPLFGKPFKRNKNGTLQCEVPCQAPRPSAGVNSDEYRRVTFQAEAPPPPPPSNYRESPRGAPVMDPEMYRKTPMGNHYEHDMVNRMQASRIDGYLDNKICKLCNQQVVGRRFVTYENGDVICYDCDTRSSVRPPRIKSAHIVICSFCNNAVHGRRYITEPNGKILCDKCEQSAPKCRGCARPIALDANPRRLSNNATYHPECFTCSSCNNVIHEVEFYENKSNEPLCLSCFETQKLPKCLECKKPCSGGYFMVDNQAIHKECFKCNQCSDSISPEGGYFKNPMTSKPICQKCHLLNTAPKCGKCGRVIEKDGCTYADKDYHQDCFVCVHCNTMLIKMKTTYRGKNDNDLCCEPCFVDRYAPKCAKCSQPISPHIPGTKYEDKMYHIECFACGRCKKTLANKKFFKVGNIQICESCY